MRKILLLLILSFPAFAQKNGQKIDSIHEEKNIIAKWSESLSKALTTLGIRKSYDATSKDESKPASFMWNNDFQNGQDYLVIDLGLKITDWTIGNGGLILNPKFEWHRDDTQEEGKKKNTIGGGLNYEYINPKLDEKLDLVPFILGSIEYKYDQVKPLQTLNGKLFLSAYGNKEGHPNYQHRDKKTEKLDLFEYSVMTGFEYYQDIQQGNLHCTAWASRLYTELSPITVLNPYLQLTADYTMRIVTSDNLYNKGNLQWLAVAANLYFNKKRNIGVGVEYAYGEDPLTNFVKTDKISFGIKIKV